MGVDALSTLLMKNPRFNLLPVDLSFLRSFQSVWKGLETDEAHVTVERNEVIYQLPSACYDPALLLMFFRQNISGSTFFHIRNEPLSDEIADPTLSQDIAQDEYQADLGCSFFFKEKDFALYFNASPAQLDPSFQPVTTLTEAGKNLSSFILSHVKFNCVSLQYHYHDYRAALLSYVWNRRCFDRY